MCGELTLVWQTYMAQIPDVVLTEAAPSEAVREILALSAHFGHLIQLSTPSWTRTRVLAESLQRRDSAGRRVAHCHAHPPTFPQEGRKYPF
jgi:hypothetical protein